MTESEEKSGSSMFLYENPELLTEKEHGHLGIEPSEKPYTFAANVRAVPLTMTEFANAGRHYPIVFTSLENPYPVAVVGLQEDDNLFMNDGAWEDERYVPAYLRCHPFAFAAEKDGRVAVMIDRSAVTITENAKYPFFADSKLGQEAESMVRMCAQYDAERKRTMTFSEKLRDLGLLSSQRASHTPEGSEEEVTLSTYISINAELLTKLDDSAVLDMHRSGELAACYLQLYSMENWTSLLWRREMRRRKES